MRWFVRLASKWEGLQLRVLGTTFIATTRRRDVLLLETVGRKTGKRRRTPVTYIREADGSYTIGGGAGGMTKVDWVANLRQQTEARVYVKRKTIDVFVRELQGAERDQARADAGRRFPEIAKYEAVSERPIPYFRLVAR